VPDHAYNQRDPALLDNSLANDLRAKILARKTSSITTTD